MLVPRYPCRKNSSVAAAMSCPTARSGGHVLSVEQAKTAPTRQRRIEAAVAELSGRA
jgi:hypothetical protein